jgi:hypothetical protein
MIVAHILGIPVEETALAFVPVMVLFIAGARGYARQAGRRLRACVQRGMRNGHPTP